MNLMNLMNFQLAGAMHWLNVRTFLPIILHLKTKGPGDHLTVLINSKSKELLKAAD